MMKKSILVVAMLIIAFSFDLYAQPEKGNFLINSYFGPNEISLGKKYYDISINMQAGYFFTNKLSFGVTTLFETRNINTLNRSDFYRIGAGPYLKYYIFQLSNNLIISLDGTLYYIYEDIKGTPSAVSPHKCYGYAGIVFNYFFNDNIGFVSRIRSDLIVEFGFEILLKNK